jgi:hypothetical protein
MSASDSTKSIANVRARLASGLAQMTYGAADAKSKVDQEEYALASGEMIQRLHVPMTGIAGKKLIWSEIDVKWAYPILNQAAANQHESEQDQPHYMVGIEVQTAEHLMIDCQVSGWKVDEETGFYIGATLRLTVWIPDATKLVPYAAVAHVAFVGWAATGEDDTDDSLTPPAPPTPPTHPPDGT